MSPASLRPTFPTLLIMASVLLVLSLVTRQSTMTFPLAGDQGAGKETREDTYCFGVINVAYHWDGGAWSRDGAAVSWIRGGAVVILMYAGSRVWAGWVERRLGPSRSVRMVAGLVVAVALLSGFAAIALSKYYWGFWLSRPGVERMAARVAVVKAISFVASEGTQDGIGILQRDGTNRTREVLDRCASDEYYCLVGRILQNLERRHVLREPTSPVSDVAIDRVRVALEGSGQLVAGEAGYVQAGSLSGVVVLGEDAVGVPVLLAGLASQEVANDHHAYYELAIGGTDATALRILDFQRFYFDLAGIEGVEWLSFFLIFTLLGLVGGLPLATIVVVVISRGGRRSPSPPTECA